MKQRLPPLIVIVGPTGSGKSELAIDLAKKFNGEIISADSRQIYRGMVIGTGAVCQLDRMQNYCVVKGVRHYMLGIVEPWEEYNVADFKQGALAIIQDILVRGKLPILVGGTNLWVQAIVENLGIPNVPPNKKLRQEFERKLEEPDVAKKLYDQLLRLDPDAEQFVPKDNPRRIIRALEVYLATGKPFSKLRKKGKPLFRVLKIGTEVSRDKLYPMIDRRMDAMVKRGLQKEVVKVFRQTCRYIGEASQIWNLPAFSGIGYREWRAYLELPSRTSQKQKNVLIEAIIQRIKYNTHAYVRRQMTWLKRDESVKLVKNKTVAARFTQNFLGFDPKKKR